MFHFYKIEQLRPLQIAWRIIVLYDVTCWNDDCSNASQCRSGQCDQIAKFCHLSKFKKSLDGLVSIWQNVKHSLAKILCHWAYFFVIGQNFIFAKSQMLRKFQTLWSQNYFWFAVKIEELLLQKPQNKRITISGWPIPI